MSMRAGLLVCVAMLVALGVGFAGGYFVGSKRATLAIILPGSGGGAKASDLYGEIAAHPFWRVKVSAAQVEALVAKVRAEKRGTLVFVDDGFVVGMDQEQGGDTPDERYGRIQRRAFIDAAGVPSRKPNHVGRRFVYLDLYRAFPSQPSAEEVAAALLSAIRVREYKD